MSLFVRVCCFCPGISLVNRRKSRSLLILPYSVSTLAEFYVSVCSCIPLSNPILSPSINCTISLLRSIPLFSREPIPLSHFIQSLEPPHFQTVCGPSTAPFADSVATAPAIDNTLRKKSSNECIVSSSTASPVISFTGPVDAVVPIATATQITGVSSTAPKPVYPVTPSAKAGVIKPEGKTPPYASSNTNTNGSYSLFLFNLNSDLR
jgi:hypothetical protein